MKTSEIKNTAKVNLKGKFGISLLSQVMAGFIGSVVKIIPFAGLVVSGPLDIGVEHVFIEGSDGKTPEFKDIFFGFRENFGETFFHALLKGIFLFLWSLLLVVPGIIKMYAYAMSGYLLARNTDMSAMDAIRKSQELMDGHKADLFVLDLSFLGWDLLTLITFGLAGIYVEPYKKAAKTAFFNEIYKKEHPAEREVIDPADVTVEEAA